MNDKDKLIPGDIKKENSEDDSSSNKIRKEYKETFFSKFFNLKPKIKGSVNEVIKIEPSDTNTNSKNDEEISEKHFNFESIRKESAPDSTNNNEPNIESSHENSTELNISKEIINRQNSGINTMNSSQQSIIKPTTKRRRTILIDSSDEEEEEADQIESSNNLNETIFPQDDEENAGNDEDGNDSDNYFENSQKELEDDLEDLKKNRVYDSRLRSRNSQHINRFQEAMKRRKNNQNEDDSTISLQSEEESIESETNEDNFVVDVITDEEEAATLAQIPTEFMKAMSLKDSFDLFCQVLIKNCIDLEYIEGLYHEDDGSFRGYKAIANKLDDYRSSLVQSAAWQSDFKSWVERFPILKVSQLCTVLDGCEACEKRGRKSTFELNLSGPLYDPKYLQKIPNPNKQTGMQYNVGKFCKVRVVIYHKLFHFKFNILCEIQELVREHTNEDNDFDVQFKKIYEELKSQGFIEQWYTSFEHILNKSSQLYAIKDDKD
ncbi:hypothetical protein K502DRAFT_323011 [Neoconidiobolus thromboides FSU 785]|nr:hypothetical protein K502DRAFT_323011 [Neoconidiobolus thromboides FSU 785]